MFTHNIALRKLTKNDLKAYEDLNHPDRSYHKFNGPYFEKETVQELRERMEKWKSNFEIGDLHFLSNKWVIADKINNTLIGEVSWYWKSQETSWMEIGIVIFNEDYWGKGIGYEALQLWIDAVFEMHPQLIRIGLTTWSGNERMMKLSEKLGMKLEACYRNARIVDGKYYDSISYGILKSEWMES